jgi:hypothetical protein
MLVNFWEHSLILLGMLAWSQKAPLSLPSFMCLSVCISMPSTGQVFVKFDTGDCYENLLRKSKLGKYRAEIVGINRFYYILLLPVTLHCHNRATVFCYTQCGP